MAGLENKIEGQYDFDGDCMPGEHSKLSIEAYPKSTFSVGIFQWLLKASGKGLKRSKVVYRVRGKVGNAELVYGRARRICRLFDKNPNWTGKKSETIK